jgi:hypothetical protein
MTLKSFVKVQTEAGNPLSSAITVFIGNIAKIK